MNKFFLILALVFSITDLQAMSQLEQATKKLLNGINPVKRPILHKLQKEFFVENRKTSTVERINERTLYVHDNRIKEQEKALDKQGNKEFALFKKNENGKTIDRRSVIQDHLEQPYRPISFLKIIYNLTPEDVIVFQGTGFRNGLNQIVTAGHNLTLTEKFIKEECALRNIFLNDYKFNKKRLTIESFFGFKEDKQDGEFLYSFISRINGIKSFTHEYRDFGVFSLPSDKSSFLDDNIGALGFKFLSDQPHEYTSDEVRIAGYPGEIRPIEMYSHKGPIKNIDDKGIVYYDVDTSSGNSGSPGFLELKNDHDSNVENFPVCLVHTHRYRSQELNAGEKIDEDLIQFMQDHSSS
jgi:V8-like Glu-specific endopeptidase